MIHDLLVAIDPGHGYPDSGATANGIVEKDFALRLAYHLEAMVNGMPWGARARLTRRSDKNLSLHEAGQVANVLNAELVVCIHADASENADVHGLRTFYWPGNADGHAIAERIAAAAPRPLFHQGFTRAIPADPERWERVANVLRPFKATAVLVECGFLTNSTDAGIMGDINGQYGLAAAMLCGVTEAMRLLNANAFAHAVTK